MQFISREERYTLPYRMGKLNFFTLASRLALLCNKDPFSRKKLSCLLLWVCLVFVLLVIVHTTYFFHLPFFFHHHHHTKPTTSWNHHAVFPFSLFSLYHDMLLFCSPSSVSLQVSQTLFFKSTIVPTETSTLCSRLYTYMHPSPISTYVHYYFHFSFYFIFALRNFDF